jgi:hypothetical protein
MNKILRIAAFSSIFLTLGLAQTQVFARAASNPGHGLICYNYPTTLANGTVTYERRCFKRA